MRRPGSPLEEYGRRTPALVAGRRAWSPSEEPGHRRVSLVAIGRAWSPSGEAARPILSCSQNFRKFALERRAGSQNADQARRMPTRLAECRPGSQNADQARRTPTRRAHSEPARRTPSLVAGRRAWSPDGEPTRRSASTRLAVRQACSPWASTLAVEVARWQAINRGSGRLCSMGAWLDGLPASTLHRCRRGTIAGALGNASARGGAYPEVRRQARKQVASPAFALAHRAAGKRVQRPVAWVCGNPRTPHGVAPGRER